MKFIRLYIIILGLISASLSFSQISRGGRPYFVQPSFLRSAPNNFFIDMPSFDLDSILKEDAVNKENMRRSYRFAHKFYTNIKINDCVKTVLNDGTVVKQIGIRSAGAYSINLLLRDFEIPPGGKLFIYSADHSYIVGSFDYRNNSQGKILPIQPVAGDAIIVEYSEPENVQFSGSFTIAEVNHDYRDIFRVEPRPDNTTFNCMPDVFCAGADEGNIRSTVLLTINGEILCSGSLINNTSDDGKPYLLTAVHCLVDNPNNTFPTDMQHYIERTGTIIAFFNYNRPVCDSNIKMKGNEEMSIAGATARVIIQKKDIALIEFNEYPPDYYNAYYAGWNFDLDVKSNFYTNIHHPNGAVKKYGITDEAINMITIPALSGFDSNSFWRVPKWKTGSTAVGSSGSPLFDEDGLIIGGLTAGKSNCRGISPNDSTDYFFSLAKGWETDNQNNQLKTYLDPTNKLVGVKKYKGMDPNLENPVIRLTNANYFKDDLLTISNLDSPNSGYVFGNSNLQTLEFAEEFTVEDPVEIFGAYLLIPRMGAFIQTSGVTVSVYSGDSYPEKKISSILYSPKYLNYSSKSDFYLDTMRLTVAPNETFVLFDEPVYAAKKFFISYSINDSPSAKFCVYNTKFKDASSNNKAWIKDKSAGWIKADEYSLYGQKTSLAISPLVRRKDGGQNDSIPEQENSGFYFYRQDRTININEHLTKEAQITIYSITGHIMEKITVYPDRTSYLIHEKPKGTIGIVKFSNSDFSYTRKIIY